MKINLILCILTYQIMGQIVIPLGQRCLCSDISEKSQCELINCYWDEACSENKCENRKQDKCYGECSWSNGTCTDYIFKCSDYSTQKSCDQQTNCGWASSQQCILFNSCQGFFVSEPEQCYSKGQNQCEPSAIQADGQYQCVQKVNVECGKLKSKTICNNSQQSNSVQCGWKQSTNECLAKLNFDICENAKDWQEMCDTYACIWSNGTCQSRDCGSFTIQETCKFIPNYQYTEITVCIWTDDKCQSVQSIDELPQEQCFENTNGGSMWINDGCTSCQGYTQILNIIMMVLIFTLLE